MPVKEKVGIVVSNKMQYDFIGGGGYCFEF